MEFSFFSTPAQTNAHTNPARSQDHPYKMVVHWIPCAPETYSNVCSLLSDQPHSTDNVWAVPGKGWLEASPGLSEITDLY